MQTRLLKTSTAEYAPASYSGENESGVAPVGDRVLVMPDTAAEQTSGKVFLDPRTIERGTMAAETGVLIAVGDDAFSWNSDRTRPFSGRKPKAGDRVFFERYGGQLLLGKDGIMYRLCDDKVIGGIDIS